MLLKIKRYKAYGQQSISEARQKNLEANHVNRSTEMHQFCTVVASGADL